MSRTSILLASAAMSVALPVNAASDISMMITAWSVTGMQTADGLFVMEQWIGISFEPATNSMVYDQCEKAVAGSWPIIPSGSFIPEDKKAPSPYAIPPGCYELLTLKPVACPDDAPRVINKAPKPGPILPIEMKRGIRAN